MTPEAAGAAITIRQADLGHGKQPILRRIDLDIAHGEHILLVGGNGTGKSTLLDGMAGLLAPKRGQVSVLGRDPMRERRKVHKAIGHLGHQEPLYPELTGRENLELHARLRGLAPGDADVLINAVAMTTAADRRVSTYSRGMARRIGLAKALLGTPRVLLLDEPDSGLDADGRQRLGDILRAEVGTCCVFATHHADDYQDWAHRTIRLMDDGSLRIQPHREVEG